MRDLISQVRADVITEGGAGGALHRSRFGDHLHFREKKGDALEGVFMEDARDPDKPSVYLAERGHTVSMGDTSFLVLESGYVQRGQGVGKDPAWSPSTATHWTCRSSPRTPSRPSTSLANGRLTIS